MKTLENQVHFLPTQQLCPNRQDATYLDVLIRNNDILKLFVSLSYHHINAMIYFFDLTLLFSLIIGRRVLTANSTTGT